MGIVEPIRQRAVAPDDTVVPTGPVSPVDAVVGASALVTEAVIGLTRRAEPVVRPAVRWALHPPVVPAKLRPGGWLDALGRHGATRRLQIQRQAVRLLDRLAPLVVEEVLRRTPLTTMVTRYVDLDRVVAEVDLDATAARIDVNAVADRVDVEAVLDRLDLTAVVLRRVDLDTLIRAVLERIDLAALAEQVVEVIDLPEIIRESTGSMASETVRGARMQGIAADEVVGRVRNRLLSRRDRAHDTATAVPDPTENPPPAVPRR